MKVRKSLSQILVVVVLIVAVVGVFPLKTAAATASQTAVESQTAVAATI